MTDIVERLRDLPLLYRETGDEAAAEIERLRAALREMKTKCGDPRIVSDIADAALEPNP